MRRLDFRFLATQIPVFDVIHYVKRLIAALSLHDDQTFLSALSADNFVSAEADQRFSRYARTFFINSS